MGFPENYQRTSWKVAMNTTINGSSNAPTPYDWFATVGFNESFHVKVGSLPLFSGHGYKKEQEEPRSYRGQLRGCQEGEERRTSEDKSLEDTRKDEENLFGPDSDIEPRKEAADVESTEETPKRQEEGEG